MMRALLVSTGAALIVAQSVGAQSIQQRVLSSADGAVEFSFAARPGVCGDGATYVRDGFGGQNRIADGGNLNGRSGDADWPPCVEGPVRVLVFVNGREITRMRTFAGPRPCPTTSSGTGRARRSSLPFTVNGSASSTITTEGTM